MFVTVLGSGSSGNSTLIASGESCLLVDLGFGPRSLDRRLAEAGLENQRVDAILLTHGHSDHCQGVQSFLASRQVPVYMNGGTRDEGTGLSGIENWVEVGCRKPFQIGDFQVEAFPISHDASQPVGFKVTAEGKSGAVVTDLGEMTSEVVSQLRGCDWLVLESNHDENLLRIGPYPWQLKRRVMSRLGHLSNRVTGEFLRDDYDGSAAHVFLAHLSRQNNDPEIALRSARKALRNRSSKGLFESCQIHLTFQSRPSTLITL